MGITINNKTPGQILEGLSLFVETTEKNYRGFDYRKIEDFYDRLWTVCGKNSVVVTMLPSAAPVYTTLPTGQVICSVYVEISIFDDEGNIWRRVGSWGESELILTSNEKTGVSKFDGIGNVVDTASAKAVKLALKKLDVFGYYTNANALDKEKTTSSKGNSSSKKSTNNSEKAIFSLIGTECVKEQRVDSNTGLPVYTWKCTQGTDTYNVVFYPNVYTKYNDWMERLKAATGDKPDTLIKIAAKQLQIKEGIKQLMFLEKA